METLATRLKECRLEAKLSQVELTKKARLKNQSIIGSLETGYRKSSSYIPAIADALGVEALWLNEGRGPKRRLAIVKDDGESGIYNELEDAPQLYEFIDVPIVGHVQGGDNGYLVEFEYPPGHGDGNIIYPTKNKNTYALRVRGDSMRPRIKDGEFVVVDPDYQYVPGDEVIICLKNGKKMVKEYLYQRDGVITFGSVNNGHPNITVDLKEIEEMHYVAAIIPRGSFYKP